MTLGAACGRQARGFVYGGDNDQIRPSNRTEKQQQGRDRDDDHIPFVRHQRDIRGDTPCHWKANAVLY